MPGHALRDRLTISLIATVLRSGMSFAAGLIIARELGPSSYGVMVFLLGTAAALRQLFDGGTSAAFYTLHAQQERTRQFNWLYFLWLAVQFVIPLVAILFVLPADIVARLWQHQPRGLIALAFVASFTQLVLWATFNHLGEAKRLTRVGQVIATLVAATHLVVGLVTWQAGWISVELILAAVVIEWGVATLIIAKWLDYPEAGPGVDTLRRVLPEFVRFCRPLVPYAAIGFLYEFADRWLLQTYGGSAQQGYYAAALQFGAAGAIANAAITNVFWKEVAEAHYHGRSETLARLHRRISRGLFFVAAAITGFLMPWSRELVAVTLGPAYGDGALTFAVMLFYPVHQTLGQINGTTAYATQSLSAYTALGSLSMLASIVITYFAVAPATSLVPGLGLASLGVALKMVLLQIVTVNVVSFYLTKRLGIAYDWIYQPVVAVACIASGFAARLLAEFVIGLPGSEWTRPALALAVYGLLIPALLWSRPSLAGSSRTEIGSVLQLAGFGRR